MLDVISISAVIALLSLGILWWTRKVEEYCLLETLGVDGVPQPSNVYLVILQDLLGQKYVLVHGVLNAYVSNTHVKE